MIAKPEQSENTLSTEKILRHLEDLEYRGKKKQNSLLFHHLSFLFCGILTFTVL